MDTLQEDFVGHLEGVEHRGLVVRDRQQSVVRDDNEGVDLFLQGLDACIGLGRTTLTFESEGASDHTNGECAEALGNLCDNGSCTSAGAATLTGGDEHHVGTLERLFDFIDVCVGGGAADVGIGTSAETLGEITTNVELDVGIAHQERLSIGVHRNELDTLESGVDHAIDGVNATTADANDLDHREIVLRTGGHRELLREKSRTNFGKREKYWSDVTRPIGLFRGSHNHRGRGIDHIDGGEVPLVDLAHHGS